MTNNFSNDKSIYLQIAYMIENDILRNILNEDEQTLSTNELAKIYNINPNTAAKGLTLLLNENILYKKRGIGMFVNKGSRDKILKKRKEEIVSNYVYPFLQEAKSIGLKDKEVISLIEENQIKIMGDNQ